MNTKTCENIILNYMNKKWIPVIANSDELQNILHKALKWNYKTCYHNLKKTYGWYENIISEINSKSKQVHASAEEKWTQNQYQQQVWKQIEEPVSNNWNNVLSIIGRTILTIVLIYIFWKAIRYIISFLYDVLNKHRMQYFKVILPRLDTKADREREKDVSKDMKEKIWRMAQVFRWVHKLGSLSEWMVSWHFSLIKQNLT